MDTRSHNEQKIITKTTTLKIFQGGYVKWLRIALIEQASSKKKIKVKNKKIIKKKFKKLKKKKKMEKWCF